MTPLTELLPVWKAPAPYVPEDDAEGRFRWSGYLTVENAAQVCERIRNQFAGRPFVHTSVYQYRRWEPEVNAPERIEGDVSLDMSDAGDAHIMFATSGAVWGLWSAMREQPRLRLVEPGGTGRPADVLAWIDEAPMRWSTPFLEFDSRTLTIRDRAPNGGAYWWRLDLLENRQTMHTVLSPEEAAVAYEAMENASALPYLDERIDARHDLCQRIERVFNDNDDGEKVKRWLPR